MNAGRDVYSIILADIVDVPVQNIRIGINWTLVETANGCGLAQTPRRDTPGCMPIKNAGELTGMGLRELASLVRSDNPIEIAVGMAAVNAHHNRYGIKGPVLNGLDAFRDVDGMVAVIGRFPNLDRHLKNYCVLEQEPLTRLAREGELMAYRHDGFFYAMDTYRELKILNELWDRGESPWKVWC